MNNVPKSHTDLVLELTEKYPAVPTHVVIDIIIEHREEALLDAQTSAELDIRTFQKEYE